MDYHWYVLTFASLQKKRTNVLECRHPLGRLLPEPLLWAAVTKLQSRKKTFNIYHSHGILRPAEKLFKHNFHSRKVGRSPFIHQRLKAAMGQIPKLMKIHGFSPLSCNVCTRIGIGRIWFLLTWMTANIFRLGMWFRTLNRRKMDNLVRHTIRIWKLSYHYQIRTPHQTARHT